MLETIEFIDLLNVLWAKPTINPIVATTFVHWLTQENGVRHAWHTSTSQRYIKAYICRQRSEEKLLVEREV
jgi:hypothetical protein